MSNSVNQLTPLDFNKNVDPALFSEWKKSVEDHKQASVINIVLLLAGLVSMTILQGLVGLVLFFGLSITGIALALPKNNKRKECQRKLGFSDGEIREAIERCRIRKAAHPETAAPHVKNVNHCGIEQDQAPVSTPPKYNGLQWFFKVLTHYADFSGRARRREYWYFVLFNIIFSIAWAFLIALAIAIANNGFYDFEFILTSSIEARSYQIMILLPVLALIVRRLHDIGKSGWMALILLIPIIATFVSRDFIEESEWMIPIAIAVLVGVFWMLALMLTNGQHGENKYGLDPKLSGTPLDVPKKVRSAGIALLVAASAGILIKLYFLIDTQMYFNYRLIIEFIAYALLLTASIYLLQEKQICGMQQKGRSMMILLAAVSVSFLLSIWLYIQNVGIWQIWTFFPPLMNLSMALFVAAILFPQQDKNLVRYAAFAVIGFSGLVLFRDVYFEALRNGHFNNVSFVNQLNVLYILTPISFIVLAGTFLSIKDQSVPVSVPVSAPEAPEKGKSTVFGGSARPYCILEHRTGSRYHEAGEKQKIIIDHAEIGRDPNCAVRYDEQFETVSRRHAAIIRNGNDWKLVAMSKTNPTFVNGKMVQGEWYLQHGDEIQCAVNGPKLVFKVMLS